VAWFTNKGQMIQVACAVVAATVALMVWFAVPPQQLLYAAPIVIAISFVWLATIAADKLLSLLATARAYERLKASVPSAPPTSPTVDSFKAPRPLFLHVAQVRCKVGSFWECAFDGDVPFRLVVHAISKIKGQNEHRADIEMTRGPAALVGGSETTRISSARYWVPRSSHPYRAEPRSVYSLDISLPYQVYLFSFRVEHINPNEEEVTLEVCHMHGRPELMTYP
jgi:hypothetical protein